MDGWWLVWYCGIVWCGGGWYVVGESSPVQSDSLARTRITPSRSEQLTHPLARSLAPTFTRDPQVRKRDARRPVVLSRCPPARTTTSGRPEPSSARSCGPGTARRCASIEHTHTYTHTHTHKQWRGGYPHLNRAHTCTSNGKSTLLRSEQCLNLARPAALPR
jgi:hypothetical protein